MYQEHDSTNAGKYRNGRGLASSSGSSSSGQDTCRLVSPKEIEANREGARKSTGPRTAAGKARAALNARKHGIFSTAVVLPGESSELYRSLLKGFVETFQPQGQLEKDLVIELADNRWRRQRMIRAEKAEITRSIDLEERMKLQNEALQIEERAISGESKGGMVRYIRNPFVRDRCICLIEGSRERIRKQIYDLSWEVPVFRRVFGPGLLPIEEYPADVQRKIRALWLDDKIDAQPKLDEAGKQESSKWIINMLDIHLEWLDRHKKVFDQIDEERAPYDADARLVPPANTMERIIRYEAHLSREFDRILSRLQGLQRIRLGQAIPHTLKIA
jgi:hypothetical protein